MFVCLSRNESRGILSDRDDNSQWMVYALPFVVFAQTFAQSMDLHSRNSVLGGIEAFRAFEHLDCDVIFLDLVGFTREIFRAEILQQVGQPWRTHEDSRPENSINLGLRFFPKRGKHPGIPHEWGRLYHGRSTLACNVCT